jgi:hypothetical protein
MSERLYHVVCIVEKDGMKITLSGEPMPHGEAVTFKSKLTEYPWRRNLLEEVQAPHPEPAKQTAIQLNQYNVADIRKASEAFKAWQGAENASDEEFYRLLAEWEGAAREVARMVIGKLESVEGQQGAAQ